jgi:GDSL-like lipase/acylhydrolase family protein
VLTALAILLVTALALEGLLRVLDFRDLRDGYGKGYPTVFRYDAELGWFPIPNAIGPFQGSRTFNVANNSLGLRDVEVETTTRPRVLFVGDSFLWGYDVEVKDRFTELLRKDLPGLNFVNAGIPGYGTAQEYLLLQRLWDVLKPDVVVLVVCAGNDRDDNSSNVTGNGYFRPYVERVADHNPTWRFAGQPVPRSRYVYFSDNALVRHSWLARLAVAAFVELRYPLIEVADPTDHLIAMTRDFVEVRGARFLVGLVESHDHLDQPFETFLRGQGIRYAYFKGTDHYRVDGAHWTPRGHAQVASRVRALLEAAQITAGPRAELRP